MTRQRRRSDVGGRQIGNSGQLPMKLFGRKRTPGASSKLEATPPNHSWWLFDENRGQTVNMLHIVEANVPKGGCRALMFVSPVPRVGTSSVAWAYARGAAELSRSRVLLLTTGGAPRPAIASPQADPVQSGLTHGCGAGGVQLLELPIDGFSAACRQDFWDDVRSRFDEIVVDCPAASQAPWGLQIAAHVNAVIIVLEADRTRAPVAQKLLSDLQSVHAYVLGAVLNRRRFHIPTSIYKRL